MLFQKKVNKRRDIVEGVEGNIYYVAAMPGNINREHIWSTGEKIISEYTGEEDWTLYDPNNPLILNHNGQTYNLYLEEIKTDFSIEELPKYQESQSMTFVDFHFPGRWNDDSFRNGHYIYVVLIDSDGVYHLYGCPASEFDQKKGRELAEKLKSWIESSYKGMNGRFSNAYTDLKNYSGKIK